MNSPFRVDLEIFRGPLDLLMYLVRKHELDILDIPIAMITDQFLKYLTVLEKLDVNAVGDFLEMASALIEIKSRMVLPRADEEDGVIDDPREELVHRLLEYKKYKDAANVLEQRSRDWQLHQARQASDMTRRQQHPSDQPIQEVELWDLVSAFGRIIREHEAVQPSNIVYDDTPIHTYMLQIHERLTTLGSTTLADMFTSEMQKSAMIGVFLAILELVRSHYVRAEQSELHGELWVLPGSKFGEALDLSNVEQYDPGPGDPVSV